MDEIDEDWETDLSIWVSTEKTAVEFEESLSKIIDPVLIEDSKFSIGAIEIQVRDIRKQPKLYDGIPKDTYSFEIVVPTTQGIIWGVFDKRVAYAITLGLRTKFNCSYLVTTDTEDFVFYSGTNKPYYVNLNYQPCTNGDLIPSFTDKGNVIELRI